MNLWYQWRVSRLPITKYWGNSKRWRTLSRQQGLPIRKSYFSPQFFNNYDFVRTAGFSKSFEKKIKTAFVGYSDLPESLAELRQSFPKVDEDSSSRVLVVGNTDRSPREWPGSCLVDALSLFDKVLVQNLEGPLRGFDVYPMAFSEHYIRGHEIALVRAASKLSRVGKETLCLARFGAVWPQLTQTIPDRIKLAEYLSQRPEFVVQGAVGRAEYFSDLVRAKFAICPRGNGVQSPKIFEALFFGAAPIVTRCFTTERLYELGVPVLVIDDWSQLSRGFLELKWPVMAKRLAEFMPLTRDAKAYFKFTIGAQVANGH